MERRDLGRVVSFSDGVIAVAITLLVLNIEVPSVDDEDLGGALRDLVPSLAAYVFSFVLIGRYWVVHHYLYETLKGFDGRLMALNLAFLMFIALFPFATDLIDEYPNEAIAAATFGMTVALAALTHWLATWYALRQGFVKPERVDDSAPFGSSVALGFAAIFLLSVPAAFVSVHLAQVLWVSTFALRYPLRRLSVWASR